MPRFVRYSRIAEVVNDVPELLAAQCNNARIADTAVIVRKLVAEVESEVDRFDVGECESLSFENVFELFSERSQG